MIERFLEQQPAIFAVFLSFKDLRKRENDLALLSDSDITNAEDVMKKSATQNDDVNRTRSNYVRDSSSSL